jgi:hypothetical protein
MGVLQLLLVVLLTVAPFVAADRAERSNGWVHAPQRGIRSELTLCLSRRAQPGALDPIDGAQVPR